VVEELQNKLFLVTPPGAIVDNAALTTASIDTKGFHYLSVYVVFGAMDIAMAVLKIQNSNTDSAYADVTNGNFATGTLPTGSAATLPSATSDNTVFAWHGPTKKRYYDVAATAGDGAAGTYCTIFAILSRAEEAPNTTAERGLVQELFI
jgi:hypothetical protein